MCFINTVGGQHYLAVQERIISVQGWEENKRHLDENLDQTSCSINSTPGFTTEWHWLK